MEDVSIDEEGMILMAMDVQKEMTKAAVTLVSTVVDGYVREGAKEAGQGSVVPGGARSDACPAAVPQVVYQNNYSALVAAAVGGALCKHVLYKIKGFFVLPETAIARPRQTSRGRQSPCTYDSDVN